MGYKRREARLFRVGVTVVTAFAVVTGFGKLWSPPSEIAFASMPGAAGEPSTVGPHTASALSPVAEAAAGTAQASIIVLPSLASHALLTWGLVAACGGVLALRKKSRARLHMRSCGSSPPIALKEKRTGDLECAVEAESEEALGQGIGSFPRRTTPLLDSLNDEGPQATRDMSISQLMELAKEVRWQVLDAVSVTGGHLGSSLGVVELTVALHHIFDTPHDEICWDVAHQCYPHKVLTGRRGRIYTLRQRGGLSGFAKRAESVYDDFGAGHSSTSISAALGFQVARDFKRQRGHSVAVIGDGAITGGMAWEAMNHAGGLKSKIITILNDNGQVSLPTCYNSVGTPVGALAQTLASQKAGQRGLSMQGGIARFESSKAFQKVRQFFRTITKEILPPQLFSAVAKIDEYSRDFFKTVPFLGSGAGSQGELFEQLGFYYVGPIDGHDMKTLVSVLGNLKRDHEEGLIDKPIMLHVKTRKGKGYSPAEIARDRFHAVGPKFNVKSEAAPSDVVQPTETASTEKPKQVPLTTVFGNALVEEGERDEDIVAITAAMPGGTGVHIFEKRFGPSRTFDVGIAEQHAVTFAAALAAKGLKPFVAIYSTFLQRGYDQVIHDVAIQNLPVRFVLDRAGLVGSDGPTHAGAYDLSYLACIPNLKICAPSDEAELVNMTHTLAKLDDGPSCMRYPRGKGLGQVEMPEKPEFLEPGKGRIVREGRGGSIAILSVGTRLSEALEAADRLGSWGISATVADARWVKPLDEALVKQLANDHRVLITVEENSIGGFSAQVSHSLQESGCFDGVDQKPLVFRSMQLPDRFIAADEDPKAMYDDAELNATHIMSKAFTALQCADVQIDSPVIGSTSLQDSA